MYGSFQFEDIAWSIDPMCITKFCLESQWSTFCIPCLPSSGVNRTPTIWSYYTTGYLVSRFCASICGFLFSCGYSKRVPHHIGMLFDQSSRQIWVSKELCLCLSSVTFKNKKVVTWRKCVATCMLWAIDINEFLIPNTWNQNCQISNKCQSPKTARLRKCRVIY